MWLKCSIHYVVKTGFFSLLPAIFFGALDNSNLQGVDRMSYVIRLSKCGLSTSDGVPNPDSKEYWNNLKNDMSLFSATTQLLLNFFQ